MPTHDASTYFYSQDQTASLENDAIFQLPLLPISSSTQVPPPTMDMPLDFEAQLSASFFAVTPETS